MASYRIIGNQVSVMIGMGIVGFLFAIIMLGGKSCDGEIRYKELTLANKDTLVKQIYGTRLARLRDTVKIMYADTARYGKILPVARKTFNTTFRDSVAFSSANVDTSMKYFTNLLIVNRSNLFQQIASTDWKMDSGFTKDINFTYVDTTAAIYDQPHVETLTLQLQRYPYKTLMRFFDRNPLFGFWLIFSIAQLTLWFLVVPLLAGMLRSIKNKVTGIPSDLLSLLNWIVSSILPFLFFALFIYLFYWRLIDEGVILDHYFLEGYNQKMFWYAAFGYMAAISCFGMYLLTSMALDELNKQAQKNKTAPTDQALQESYAALKNAFDASFQSSAIILSVFVLWVGITFNAVNQTEAMRFYSIFSGKPFLSGDFVYLVGAMHTVILLLFYIPVRMKFNALKITEDARAASAPSGNKILNNLYQSLIAILVTASPLITSVIQKLLSGFIGS